MQLHVQRRARLNAARGGVRAHSPVSSWSGLSETRPRRALCFQGAEVPCRAARRRVISAVWVAEAAVTPPGARAPEARCRLSTTRARRRPPGRARWSTIRILTRRHTLTIIRTRPDIIHRHRHRRRITPVTCLSIPGTRRTLIPDCSRKCRIRMDPRRWDGGSTHCLRTMFGGSCKINYEFKRYIWHSLREREIRTYVEYSR